MAAALSITNLNMRGTATVSLSGDSNNTARTIQIAHPGGETQNISVTTNGSGAASATFVPQGGGGSYTFTVLSIPATIVTKTMQSSHS